MAPAMMGLTPEERLAGLEPEQIANVLSDDYIAPRPDDAQREVLARRPR